MTVGETIIGFDFDDIIQYHARNLYELFYKRKGQTKDYPLVIRKKKVRPKTKRTPEEQRKYRSEITKRYRLRNLEKVREKERIRQKRYRLKRKQEIEEIK